MSDLATLTEEFYLIRYCKQSKFATMHTIYLRNVWNQLILEEALGLSLELVGRMTLAMLCVIFL